MDAYTPIGWLIIIVTIAVPITTVIVLIWILFHNIIRIRKAVEYRNEFLKEINSDDSQ